MVGYEDDGSFSGDHSLLCTKPGAPGFWICWVCLGFWGLGVGVFRMDYTKLLEPNYACAIGSAVSQGSRGLGLRVSTLGISTCTVVPLSYFLNPKPYSPHLEARRVLAFL